MYSVYIRVERKRRRQIVTRFLTRKVNATYTRTIGDKKEREPVQNKMLLFLDCVVLVNAYTILIGISVFEQIVLEGKCVSRRPNNELLLYSITYW